MSINPFGSDLLDPLTGATVVPSTAQSGPVAPFGLPVDPSVTPPAPAGSPAGSSPATPQGTPPPQGAAPAAPAGQSGAINATNTGQSNPFALSQAMSIMQGQITNNNALVDQKNLILQQMYGVPLSDAQKANLDPALASVLNSGDRNAIDFNLRLLNDQIAGRTNTLDQSVQTLTAGYQQQVQQAETNRQNALANVQNFVTQYGSNAGAALQALYGPDYVNQLAQMGINLPGFEAAAGTLPTVNQQRYSAQYGFTSGAGNVGGYDLSSYATAPGYASRVAGIASSIGPVTDATSANAAISQLAPNSPVTGDMIMQAANQYGVDPTVILSLMQADTKMGTDGSFGSRVNNYGDVGVNDTLAAKIDAGTATPAEIASVSMTPQGGVDAVAKWLSQHPAQQSNVDTVAQGVINGTVPPPPMSSRPTQYMLQLEAALQNKGYNLTQATEDWTATQKWLATANSAQQLRLRQAINFAGDSLDVISQMNQAWNGSGFPSFNKAALAAAEQGVSNAPLSTPLNINVPNPDGSTTTTTIKDKQTLANLLNAQISDLTSEMGTVYKGGYSSTDDSLALAAKNLSSDWSYDTLQSAIDLAKTNLQIRSNSIATTGPVTASGTNPYAPAGTTGAGASGATDTSNNDPLGILGGS